ncbi:MAG: hypothetical protein ACRD52_01570 [Candidatus Acidiferrales bacterium]
MMRLGIPSQRLRRGCMSAAATGVALAIVFFTFAGWRAAGQSLQSGAWAVSLILPPHVVAGQPATLAVVGADGKLLSGITVNLGRDLRARTDATGRAFFTVPVGVGVLIAKASGSAAAALVDAEAPTASSQGIRVPPFVSLKDTFSICGAGFRGDAEANRVTLNDLPVLVLAASPECLVALPSPQNKSGPAKIDLDAAGADFTAATTLVSLVFETPNPPLTPEKKSRLAVAAGGTTQPLAIVVENETPGVLRFLRGDTQERQTSGGAPNQVSIEVQAIRSGDFSFHARLLPSPDASAAQRYLEAAIPLAGSDLQRPVSAWAKRLAQHPDETEKARHEIDKMLSVTMGGDFRTLLEAARDSL